MATNYVYAGETLEYANSGSAIASGDVVVIGNIIGVALVDIAATSGTGTVAIEGVFDLPKVDGAVIAQGEKLVWDVSAGKFDDGSATPASGDVSVCCVAMEGKGVTTGATIQVKLNVGVGTVTA
jgi:predicted RecA/RadA family phage recombinase